MNAVRDPFGSQKETTLPLTFRIPPTRRQRLSASPLSSPIEPLKKGCDHTEAAKMRSPGIEPGARQLRQASGKKRLLLAMPNFTTKPQTQMIRRCSVAYMLCCRSLPSQPEKSGAKSQSGEGERALASVGGDFGTRSQSPAPKKSPFNPSMCIERQGAGPEAPGSAVGSAQGPGSEKPARGERGACEGLEVSEDRRAS